MSAQDRGPRAGQPARGGSVVLWQPWVQKRLQKSLRNSEGVAMACESADGDATPSGLRLCEMMALSPGLPKRNPGLKFANAFSVMGFPRSSCWTVVRLAARRFGRRHSWFFVNRVRQQQNGSAEKQCV